jgi:hypothetical protein
MLLRTALAGVWGGLLVLGAHAAPVQESSDLLQRQDAAAPTAAGKTLDRALSVDAHIGQRNLDLLLESRSAGEAVEGGAAPPGAGELPARRAAALPPGAGVQHEWLGAVPGAGVAGGSLPGADGRLLLDPGPLRGGIEAAREIDPSLRGELVREAVGFLRENRYWLLGALALVAAVLAGVQAYLRHPRATPEHRAEQLTAQHSQRRTRRRSSRRA